MTVNNQKELEGWCQANTLSRHSAQSAKIILLLNEGERRRGISDSIQVSTQTVFGWRKHYSEQDLEGIYDVPRPNMGLWRYCSSTEIGPDGLRPTFEPR